VQPRQIVGCRSVALADECVRRSLQGVFAEEILNDIQQRGFAGLPAWEAVLISSAVMATPELRDRIKREADRLIEAGTVSSVPEVEQVLKTQ